MNFFHDEDPLETKTAEAESAETIETKRRDCMPPNAVLAAKSAVLLAAQPTIPHSTVLVEAIFPRQAFMGTRSFLINAIVARLNGLRRNREMRLE